MASNIVEIKQDNSNSMIDKLEELISEIKDAPTDFKHMVVIVQRNNHVELFNNKEITPIHLLGLIEFAKLILTTYDDSDE